MSTTTTYLAVGGKTSNTKNFLSLIIPQFLAYAEYEKGFSKQTLTKYQECLNWIIKDIGDFPIEEMDLGKISILRQKISQRGAGHSRMASIIYALKHLLKFCIKNLQIKTQNPNDITPPKRPKREVIFLHNEEVKTLLNSIKLTNKDGSLSLSGLRFRTFVEVLLGSAMRTSEALSLNRDSIDFARKEVKIIGKGNKERVVFISEKALGWVKHYLEQRTDNFLPLFITQDGNRVNIKDISKTFQGYVRNSGISKRVTPTILRHTAATNLLFNGCPIAHIKEILGHEKLETTCKFYLGLDKQKAKEAHAQYLNY